MKHITVLVSNDLTHDQRVRKVCDTLLAMGFEITLAGRKLRDSQPLERPYEVKRFRLWFTKGALFYANLNIRLYLYLLFAKTDIILANDLDTLWPAYAVAKGRGKQVVYDSHEYFTEAAGLTARPFPKKVWLSIEKRIFPKLKRVYTVNRSIAGFYEEKYKVPVKVVRNVPPVAGPIEKRDLAELGVPSGTKCLLLQGAFIDYDRGCLEAIQAMKYLEGAILLIIGAGQAIPDAKRLVEELKLDGKVKFFPKMKFEELRRITASADVGLSLDKPKHLNYTYSLPNKLFDYIQAQTPVVASPLPEIQRVFSEHRIGLTIDSHDPKAIATCVEKVLEGSSDGEWTNGLVAAAREFNWENEEKILREIYSSLL